MVGQEFINLFGEITVPNKIGLIDFSDKLGLFTCIIFLLLCTTVSIKQYVLNSISCYVPVLPSGENFMEYIANYCWVHGTIPLKDHEPLPKTEEKWLEYDKQRRINYYQWVPFVLGLQCIFFYIPHIAWQAICSQRSGGDLFALVQSAANAATQSRAARAENVSQVAEFLEDMIEGHKSCPRRGRRARISERAHETCGLCIVSKRLGTCLVFSYLVIKVVTIINAILQIYLIQRFLGFHSTGSSSEKSMSLSTGEDGSENNVYKGEDDFSGFGFGLTVARHIRSGIDWPETLLFPRVAYCRVPGIRMVGGENSYTAQCALPINMLNEKIYIFLWFWIVFVVCVSIFSLFLWLSRLIIAPQRKDFVKRYLRTKHMKNVHGEPINREDLDDFIDGYLRRDGVFLVRMMSLNAGEVITSEIVQKLWEDYCKALPPVNIDYPITEKDPDYFLKQNFKTEVV